MLRSAEYTGIVHETWDKFFHADLAYNFWIFRLKGVTKAAIEYSLDRGERELLNAKYAYFSWPWFGYKALWDRVLNPTLKVVTFGKYQYNINKEHNWYFKDCYCTEDVWHTLDWMLDMFPIPKLQELLNKYFPDTYDPLEFRELLFGNPDLFELVAKRENGVFTVL
jgi:hypothetical protein